MGLQPEYQITSAPVWPGIEMHVRPSPVEVALSRMASALEKLVDQQESSGDIVEWLSSLSHEELDAAVMRRQTLGNPVMHTVLEVLKEWAARGRA